MKKILSVAILVLFVGFVACGRKESAPKEYVMNNDIDSVSYAMGMNIALNLYGIDSLLNVDAVCQAIRDVYESKPKMNADEARFAFLKYMNFDVYERTKEMERRYLEDLRKVDRKFVATNSGLTYKVIVLGDVKSAPRSSRDSVVMNYQISNVAGEILDTTYYSQQTLRYMLNQLPKGVQEAVRLIGPGGHIEAWVPSALAYSSAGCDSIGVKPNTMLLYDIKLKDVIKR